MMEQLSKSHVMMDYVRLEKEVRQKAKEYLGEITEDNLKSFAESTKYIAQSVFEKYYLEVDHQFSDGALKIKDEELFDKFMDFRDGYRASMKKWMADNEISIREMKVDPTISFPNLPTEDIKQTSLVIAGVGTLVAVGLFIFSELWIAVAAELLFLGTAAFIYKKKKDKQSEDYEFEIRNYEILIEKEKSRLVNGLIKDLKTWLKNAEQYSDEVLTKIGV
jgi:hypothetical protein